MPPFLQQLRDLISGLSLVRKVTIIATLVVSVGTIAYLVHLANEAAYEPLFTNMNSEDMGTIISRLDKQGIRYQVDQEKRTVLVPSTEVLGLRVKLAEEGLPRFGGIGFELFDKGGFGRSDFEQRVIYQRALEGELTRTISSIREIESARVHLVLPQKSLFVDSQQSASASVIVKLGRSGTLPRTSVQSITHLVASAVEGLAPSQVTMVDSEGHLLTASGGNDAVMAGGQAYDQKSQIEKSLENRIVELLTPVAGLGKVLARVTVDIDFTHTESTDEIVDPSKSAITQESRTTAKKSEGSAEKEASGGSSDEGTEQINYQVSKTIRHRVSPMGEMKKMSVAVLIDGTYTEENDEKVYKARAPEDLKRFEALVKNAIGFSEDRGDQLKIENMQFQSPEEILAAGAAWYEQKTTYGFLSKVIGNVLILLVVIGLFLFVIRPLMKGWQGSKGSLTGAGTALLGEGDANADITHLVQSDPESAANAIRKWLQ